MSIFTNPADAVAELQNVRIPMMATSPGLAACAASAKLEGATYFARKVQAAEAEVARRLAVFLEPTEIFPVNPPTSDDLVAIGETPWAIEPAYDMPDNFISNVFAGFLQLNQRPLISVSNIQVIHPATNQSVYDIPITWTRLDYKHAQLTVTPAGLANSAPVSMFALQMFTSGMPFPHMIWIRYRAGLQRYDPVVPDVQDVLLRLAALRVLEDKFLPQSGSISADGLSRSTSQDLSKHRDAIEAQLANLRDAINGVMLGIM